MLPKASYFLRDCAVVLHLELVGNLQQRVCFWEKPVWPNYHIQSKKCLFCTSNKKRTMIRCWFVLINTFQHVMIYIRLAVLDFWTTQWNAYIRIQLKRGLCWYRHHPKMYERALYRNSRADLLTNLLDISMRVFLIRTNVGTWHHGQKKQKNTHNCCFSWTNLWETTRIIPKLEKKRSEVIYLNLVSLIIYN